MFFTIYAEEKMEPDPIAALSMLSISCNMLTGGTNNGLFTGVL